MENIKKKELKDERTYSLSSLTSAPSLFQRAAPISTEATLSANLTVLIVSPIASGTELIIPSGVEIMIVEMAYQYTYSEKSI